MKIDESELIINTLNGNLKDFSILVKRYQEVVNGLAFTIVKDPFAAKDISQETFLAVFKNLSKLKDYTRFPAWLKKITINISRMWLRKQKKEKDLFSEEICSERKGEVPELESIDLKIENQDFYKRVNSILNSLSNKTRIPITLCFIDDMSYREAARFLGIRESTLRKRLHDAKKKLQREIVKMAENMLEEYRLPKNFAEKCICGCKRSKLMRKEVVKDMKKKDCGCGCGGIPLKNKGAKKESKEETKKGK
ncbi:MAG: hypothetical protein A3G31_12380 [Candidatus Schekmanbacteria bacterium RIFCSPLOWO2_12_FULL_38_15]|uniref:RNA polymerase sigma-70 region 2 domain-containing protein n=1 Tax=Candidatus Schekmanbacteria bacterium RIFCSPLOWO2_12_FULL_38_15 TaxID=1817883 RepID=A0A1F7SMH1_9BACT|nr:MAG: hypothetical protein A3G31_12380 [Candidatus Schekmanbacteria bacterium RIFCSPLOWO2_12_FULL_38_15]